MVHIGPRTCKAHPYVHARTFRARTIPDNDRLAILHEAYLDGRTCGHSTLSSLTMIAMLHPANSEGFVQDDEDGKSQMLRGIQQDDNPLDIPAATVSGVRYQHPANQATVDFWRSTNHNELSKTGAGPPGSVAKGVLGKMHKRYLADLESRGVEVVPTEYLQAARGRQLSRVLEARGWDDVVIKPAVSASADGTWRSSRAAVSTIRKHTRPSVGTFSC